MSPKRTVVLAAISVAAVGASAFGVAHAADQPKRVTGVSSVLDTMRTGNGVGPQDGYALGMSVAGSAIPPKGTFGPADPTVQQATQQAVAAAGSQGGQVEGLSQAGDNGIAQFQNAVQPLAVINGPANQGIDAAAGAVDSAASALGTQIQPLDATLHQTAALLRLQEAPPGG